MKTKNEITITIYEGNSSISKMADIVFDLDNTPINQTNSILKDLEDIVYNKKRSLRSKTPWLRAILPIDDPICIINFLRVFAVLTTEQREIIKNTVVSYIEKTKKQNIFMSLVFEKAGYLGFFKMILPYYKQDPYELDNARYALEREQQD